jgi:hypothetical protein
MNYLFWGFVPTIIISLSTISFHKKIIIKVQQHGARWRSRGWVVRVAAGESNFWGFSRGAVGGGSGAFAWCWSVRYVASRGGGAAMVCRRILDVECQWCCENGRLWCRKIHLVTKSSISTVYHGDSIENEHCAVKSCFYFFIISAGSSSVRCSNTLRRSGGRSS